ncbi:unnamed protein product [Caenorhabditis bovis]|uniref:Uncharacterized protein n=1 Tax=Caenorhabditis bovis TaxID=2654633 RepID=A0A8S1EIA7_9PELO|nr:unnamed protein product [Caenorhabditis bovis]
MCVKMFLLALLVVVLHVEISSALYVKRADHDDPRLFSAVFGKRAVESERYYPIRIETRGDLDDPRFMTMSFGKRALLPTLHDLQMYVKRGRDIDDPRFFSGAFGKK